MDTTSAAPAAPATIPLFFGTLPAGERWIGIVSVGMQLHHVILLPGDNDDADWETQMAWAKEKGGDLPSRVEQALLLQEAKDEFKPDVYWSNTPYASYESFAWLQSFDNGGQYYDLKVNVYRARAVRRVPIQ